MTTLPADTRQPETFAGVALVDLLDRVLGTGVVVSGELVLSIAEVDLVYISLRALIASVRPGVGMPAAHSGEAGAPDRPGDPPGSAIEWAGAGAGPGRP